MQFVWGTCAINEKAEKADAGKRLCFNFSEPWEEIQFEFSYRAIPTVRVFITFFLSVGLSKCIPLSCGKQCVHSVAFQGHSYLHDIITLYKEQIFVSWVKPDGLLRQFIKIPSFGL